MDWFCLLKIGNIPVFIVMCSVVFTILTGVDSLDIFWVSCLNPTYKIGDRSGSPISNSFVANTTIDPNSIPIDIFSNGSVFDISSEQTSVSQIASDNLSRSQVSTVQNSASQIGFYKSSPTKPGTSQISSTEVGKIQTSFVEQSSTEISPTQVNSLNIGLGEIQPTEVDSTQITLNGIADIQSVASKVSDSSSVESENFFVLKQWFIDHAFAPQSSVNVSNTLNTNCKGERRREAYTKALAAHRPKVS